MWLPDKREFKAKERTFPENIPRDGKPVPLEQNVQKGEQQKLKSKEIWSKENTV